MDETPGDVAQAEVARQVVILLFSVAGVLLYVWVQRWAGDPDMVRSQRMRLAKGSERFWAKLAARAWKLAEAARLEYEREAA